MKINHLTLNAFGPFKDKVEINFDELKENKLFLVAGETGSGKTTLFDAIVFALYGEVSSSDKNKVKQDVLKSHFSEPNEKAYVSLRFTHDDTHYTLFRSVPYKKNGVKQESECTLTCDDFVLERIKEVNKKVQEMIGLTLDQFKQVILLPQGDFRKLLFAKSDEKQALFRKIFNTEKIGQFSKYIEDKYKIIKKDVDTQLIKLEQILQMIQTQDEIILEAIQVVDIEVIKSRLLILNDEVNQKYQLVSTEIDKLSKDKIILQRRIEDQLEYQSILKQKQELALKRKSIDEIKQQILAIQLKIKIEREIKTRQILEKSYQQQLKQLKQYEDQYHQTLQKQILVAQNLKDSLIKYNTLEALSKEIDETQVEIEQYQKKNELLKLQNQQKIFRQNVKKFDFHFEKISFSDDTFQKLQSYLKVLSQDQQTQEFIENELKSYEILHAQTNRLNQEYQHTHQNYIHSVGAMLALELKPHHPCPVCGSTHHPAINHHDKHHMDIEMVKKLKQDLESAQQKQLVSITKIDAYKKQLQTSYTHEELIERIYCFSHLMNKYSEFKQFEEMRNRLFDWGKSKQQTIFGNIETLEQQIQQKKHTINESFNYRYQDEETANQRLSALILHKQNIEHTHQTIIHEDQLIQQKLAQLNRSIKEYQHQSNQSQELVINQNDLIEKLQKQWIFNSEYHTLSIEEKEMNRLENEVNDFEKTMYSLETKQSDLENKGINKTEEIEPLNNQIQELQNQISILKNLSETYTLERSNYDKIQKLIYLQDQSLKEKQEKLNELYPLYVLCSGEKESNYLSFENYVLGMMFENILVVANDRLKIFSQGRYQFLRSDEKEGNQRSTGLDLHVYDTYTGVSRSVKSLSGGESFMASLSLALGLSDVIRLKLSNEMIDMIFIDEGFGTLDKQSLDQVFTILNDLGKSQTVGIISHVPSLMEEIPTQIQVIKTNQGSKIKIKKR